MRTNPTHPHRDRRGRRLARAAALVAVALLAGACTAGGQPGGGAPPQPGKAPAPAASPAAGVPGDLVGLVLSGASLAREGDGVTLRFTVTSHAAESVTIGDLLGPDGLTVPASFDAAGAYLFDGVARKRFDVAREGGACRCAKVPLAIEPGQALELSAGFPDPGAATVSAVVPHFAALDGLRVQG